MKLKKIQRQMFIWIMGLVILSTLIHYFGTIMIWGLSILLLWSFFDYRIVKKLEDATEKGSEAWEEVKDVADKITDIKDTLD